MGCGVGTGSVISTSSTANVIGCAKLYTIVDHHPLINNWCDDGSGPNATVCPTACSTTVTPGCNLSADERFDLDREDLDGIAGNAVVPADD